MTLRKHLDDMKWKFFEKGMQVEWNFFSAIANGTTQGTTPTGAGAIGALDVDAIAANGFTTAVATLTNPSGQLNLKANDNGAASTTLEYGSGAVPRIPRTNFR